MINYALTFLTICPSNWKVWYYEGRPNPEHKSDLQLGNSQFFLKCQKSAIYELITWAKEKKSISFLLYYFLFGDRRLYWIRQGTNFEQNVKYYHPNFTPSLEHCVFQGMHCIFKKKNNVVEDRIFGVTYHSPSGNDGLCKISVSLLFFGGFYI